VSTVQARLLLQEVGVHREERWQRFNGIDDAEGVGELGAEVAHDVDNEVLIGDGMTDVREIIL
jgi:hypothetical protein